MPPLNFEFVAPQSELRTSKRPRKPLDSSKYIGSPSISALSNLPLVSTPKGLNSEPEPASAAPPNLRLSSASMAPVIPIPIPAQNNPTLLPPAAPKRTPLRIHTSSKTPSHGKAVLPSLTDYNNKITFIDVPKAINSSSAVKPSIPSVPVASTPKVESWTSRFMSSTGGKPTIAAALASSTSTVFIKPLDTSKIIPTFAPVSATSNTPKFPLNLANISNISSLAKASGNPSTQPATAKVAAPASTLPPPESPLTRAKRIDSENMIRDQQMQSKMASTAEKLKHAIGQLRSSDEPKPEPSIVSTTANPDTKIAELPKLTTEKAIDTLSHGIPEMETSKHPQPASQPSTLAPPVALPISRLPVKPKNSVLPSPKVPSRLAEAFTGIDAELPPIDFGLIDDDKALNQELGKITKSTTTPSAVAPSALNASSANSLHKTAVLNSSQTKAQVPEVAAPIKEHHLTALAVQISPSRSCTSPKLPDILSSDDELERSKKNDKENRPVWAQTPNLALALNAQRAQKAEDIFGQVQPIKLEGNYNILDRMVFLFLDFFKGSGKKFPNRTSTSNWHI